MQNTPIEVPIYRKGGVIIAHMLIDAQDEALVCSSKWCLGANGYACARRRQKTVTAHRVIMNAKHGQIIDHINGNKLDNRRDNLRFATPQQNGRNSRLQIGRSSRYKGVSWNKERSKWRASLNIQRKTTHLGYFQDELTAARRYDAAARELFGEFARVNFPD